MAIEEMMRQIAREEAEAVFTDKTKLPRDAWERTEKDRARLAAIMAKRYVSATEAAFLLGCSDGHVRNLAKKAKSGSAIYPIPFVDLDGVVTFPLDKLLEWAERPKLRKAG